ncbi:MAG: BON domain-containing protein [Rhodovibrio sp.]|nr:BON domain-containing protein [Rhodovibrio sp.]
MTRAIARARPRLRLKLAAVLCLAAPLGLAACSPAGMAVGAGATVGVASFQERGLGGAIEDSRIRIQINDLWLKEDEILYRKAGLQVQNGRVLVTGVMPSEEMRAKAIELAWQADGVKEVINEVQIGDGSFGDYSQDTWISTQLKADLLLDAEVSSINYSIQTVRGVVYLIGIAQSDQELERVLNHARGLANVRKVVSYVQVKTEPREPSLQETGPGATGDGATGDGQAPSTGGDAAPSSSGSDGGNPPSSTEPVSETELDA